MPELPEVERLTTWVGDRVAGLRVTRCELASFSALKTVDPPLSTLVGRQAVGGQRRGKHVCLDFDGQWLVVHLARGGWLRWYDSLPALVARPGRKGPMALRMGFDDGSGFDLTEAGTEKRLALWVVHAPDDVPSIASLGVDPLSPSFTADRLGELLGGLGATLKTALATEALQRTAGLPASALKGDKHRAMQVHGRTGLPCPICGDTVRQVSFASRSMQYCPTCQTGGRVLADRRLSRLLK